MARDSVYHDEMPRLLYEMMSKGLSQKLCAIKLRISPATLQSWFRDAEENGKKSPFYELYFQKELAKADRALTLMEKLEYAAQRRDPAQLRWMLNRCDDDYDLPESNKNANEPDQDQPQLTDSEMLTLMAKAAGIKK